MAYFIHAFLVLLMFVMVKAQYDTSGAGSCAAVLQAGVYNTFQTSSSSSASSSTSSYTTLQTSICKDYSSYTYGQYQQDYASSSSSSTFVNFNIAANYFGIGGSVSGSKGSAQMTSDNFQSVQTSVTSSRLTQCSLSSSASEAAGQDAFNNAVDAISQTVSPAVEQAYIQCLNLFASGVQVTQTTDIYSRSLSLDFKFVTTEQGATAQMTGKSIFGTATCSLKGKSLPKGATSSFNFTLIENNVYTVVCVLPSSVPADGGVTTVWISCTPGGSYRALLFHSPPVNQLAALQSQVTDLQYQVALLTTLPATSGQPGIEFISGNSGTYSTTEFSMGMLKCYEIHINSGITTIVPNQNSVVSLIVTGGYNIMSFACGPPAFHFNNVALEGSYYNNQTSVTCSWITYLGDQVYITFTIDIIACI